MLFLRLVPRPPLWDEAVELADDVRELHTQETVVCSLIHNLQLTNKKKQTNKTHVKILITEGKNVF